MQIFNYGLQEELIGSEPLLISNDCIHKCLSVGINETS